VSVHFLRKPFFTPSTDLSFSTPLPELPQRRHKCPQAMWFMGSGVADNETRFDWRGAFCWRGGNTKMSKWLPQRCSPRQSWPLRRGGFLREGEGGLFGDESSEMSVWLRVRNVFF